MSKEVLINTLNLCENGNEMLQFLDGISDYQKAEVQSDAVDFSGQPVNF